MTAATLGTAVTSQNPNTTTNTSLAVALASTTPGDLNVIEICGLSPGTVVNPTMTTPSGWTKVGETLDNSGTACTFTAIYWRFYQSGDGSSVTFSWANAGQMVAVCTPWTGADTTTPIPYSFLDFKVPSNTSYSVSGTTSGGDGFLNYGFANHTGSAWSAMSDTERGQVTLAASITMVSRVTVSEVTSGTAYTKTATGSNTSNGTQWAYTIMGSSAPVEWVWDNTVRLG